MALTAPRGFAGGQMADFDYGIGAAGGAWVETATAFAVTAVGGTRTVSLAAGTACGYGVRVSNDAALTQALTAPGSGGAWYLIALRFSWSAKTVTLQTLAGPTTGTTTAPTAIPASLPGTALSTPGTTFDLPLAWAFVNSADTSVVLFDVRMRSQFGGGVAATTLNALQVLALQLPPLYGARVQTLAPTPAIEYRWNGSKWCPFTSGWIPATTWSYSGINLGSGSGTSAEYRWDAGMVLFRSWIQVGSSPSASGNLNQTLPEPVSYTYNSAKSLTLDSRVTVRDPGGTNRLYVGRVTPNGENGTSVAIQLDIADTTYLYLAPFNGGAPISIAAGEQIWTEIRYESANYPLS